MEDRNHILELAKAALKEMRKQPAPSPSVLSQPAPKPAQPLTASLESHPPAALKPPLTRVPKPEMPVHAIPTPAPAKPEPVTPVVRKINDPVHGHLETAGNRIYDITRLLQQAEQRQIGAHGNEQERLDEWLRLSKVVRHALETIGNDLCAECQYGDDAPIELRIGALQKAIRDLQTKRNGESPKEE